jgi:arginine decarboxylase
VMPIHRLNERPVNHAVLSDITCDSDGKLDQFIDRRDVKKTIMLHRFNGEPYYLGLFLVGAYQEILGDLHNLFGDTHAVHISLGENGIDHTEGARVEHIIKGDSVKQVLEYVEFDPEALMGKLRRDVEAAINAGRMADTQAGRLLKFYEEALMGYTYLEDPNAD